MERSVQRVLVIAYLAIAVAAFVAPATPWVFWTVIMPAVPITVVVAGFHGWRRACPLATIASAGTVLAPRRRRVPRALARVSLVLPFALLAACLVLRLLAINGDGPALGAFLLALALFAALVNLAFPGRTWCNHVCPVGIVERIYTDAAPLSRVRADRCEPCTGCTASCPDLDQARAYRAELGHGAQRAVWLAFPGLVLGFYSYYALRGGSYDSFFDARWTTEPASTTLLLGSGLALAPDVPALLAAPATLVLFSGASLAAFALIERAGRTLVADPRRLRHRVLALASFAAFLVFYSFAGQPSLRLAPAVARLASIAVTVVATLTLVRRWREPGTVEPVRAAGRRLLPIVD